MNWGVVEPPPTPPPVIPTLSKQQRQQATTLRKRVRISSEESHICGTESENHYLTELIVKLDRLEPTNFVTQSLRNARNRVSSCV